MQVMRRMLQIRWAAIITNQDCLEDARERRRLCATKRKYVWLYIEQRNTGGHRDGQKDDRYRRQRQTDVGVLRCLRK